MKTLKTFEEFFWIKVDKNSKNGCWNWIGCTSKDGYGKIRSRGKTLRSHRASWIFKNGSIPKGILVCHKCDNPLCVNPDHLFLGTVSDNAKDCVSKKRHFITDENRGKNRKLTANQVREIIKLLKIGYRQHQLGRMFGVTQSQISRIKNAEHWKFLFI